MINVTNRGMIAGELEMRDGRKADGDYVKVFFLRDGSGLQDQVNDFHRYPAF
jgi:hypothetical protein